jgi:hypothetical protein
MPEDHQVLVRSGADEQRWLLTADLRGRGWLLAITSPDGKIWRAGGPDLFKALRALRRLMDPLGIRLGVNGARRDAWASGMQSDMGEGRVVYLLKEGQTTRPEQVSWPRLLGMAWAVAIEGTLRYRIPPRGQSSAATGTRIAALP